MLLRPSKEARVPGLDGLGRGEGMSCQALQTKVRTWPWTIWEDDDKGSHREWSTRGGKEEKKWHLRGRTDRIWRLVNEGTGKKMYDTKVWTWFMLRGEEGKGYTFEHFHLRNANKPQAFLSLRNFCSDPCLPENYSNVQRGSRYGLRVTQSS